MLVFSLELVFQRFPVKKSYLDLYWNLTAKIAIEMYTQSLISTSGKRNPHVSRKFLFLSSFIHWLYQTKLQRTTVQMQYLYIHTNDMLRKVMDSARNLLVSQIYLPKKKERKKEKNRTRNRQHEGKMVEMEDTTRDILMKIRGKRSLPSFRSVAGSVAARLRFLRAGGPR